MKGPIWLLPSILSGVVNGLEIAGGGGFKAQLIVNNTGSTTYHVSIVNNVFHDSASKDVGLWLLRQAAQTMSLCAIILTKILP